MIYIVGTFRSRMHLPQHRHNLRTERIEVGVDLGQIARWLVLVEVAVKGDLIADYADLPIPLVPLTPIDPSVGDVGGPPLS